MPVANDAADLSILNDHILSMVDFIEEAIEPDNPHLSRDHVHAAIAAIRFFAGSSDELAGKIEAAERNAA